MFCDNCGQQNPDSARFCTGCGRAMDGSAPASMMFAAEVGNRLRGAVEKNELLTVYTAAFYMGVHSLFALFLGIITSLGAFGGSFASASLGGFGGDKVVMAGIGGLILPSHAGCSRASPGRASPPSLRRSSGQSWNS